MAENIKNKSIKLNFVWQVGIEITNMLLPLVTSPVLARRMGAEALGIYSYVYTITYYFLQFALLGMYQYGTREIAMVRENQELMNKRFSELLVFQLVHGGIVFIAFLVYSLCFSNFTSLMLIQSFYLLGASVILINYVFSGLEEFNIIAVKTMIIRITGVVLIFAFVRSKDDLPLYTLIMSSEPFAGALVYIFLARKRVRIVRVKLKEAFQHVKGLYLIFIPILASFLYGTMDKLMLGQMSDMAQLGYYSNAEKALIAKNLAVALSVVLVPRMSSLAGKTEDNQFYELLNKSMEVIFLLTVAFGFGTAAVSSIFPVVFWGEGFAACSSLIEIMSLTLPAYGLTYVINNQFLVPLKKESIYIAATILGVVINFVLNFLLIPQYAAKGAAIATLITQFIVLICECIVIRKEYSTLNIIKENLPYVAFGIIMLIFVKRIDAVFHYNVFTLLAEIALGASVFFVLCLGFWLIFNKTMYLNILKNILTKMHLYKQSQDDKQ